MGSTRYSLESTLVFCARKLHTSLCREYSTSVITLEARFTMAVAHIFWRQANLVWSAPPLTPPVSSESLLLEVGNLAEAGRQLPNQCVSLKTIYYPSQNTAQIPT